MSAWVLVLQIKSVQAAALTVLAKFRCSSMVAGASDLWWGSSSMPVAEVLGATL
jgi:hypothetical protein